MLTVLALVLVLTAMLAVTAGTAFAVHHGQPQAGKPGLTEGPNGPPPYPHRGG